MGIIRVSVGFAALGATLVAVMGLAACIAAPAGPSQPDAPLLSELQAFGQCPSIAMSEQVQVFGSAQEWAKHRLAVGREQAPRIPSLGANFDWSGQAVVLVTIGQRRSAGYSFSLLPGAAIAQRELQMQLALTEPAPGAFSAMVLTQPCTYYRVASQAFDRVTVRSGTNAGKGFAVKRPAS